MQIPSHLQRIADYFKKSGQFYYFLVDLQGRVLDTNPLFLQTIGQAPGKLTDEFADTIFPLADQHKYQKAIMRCFQNPGMTVSKDLNVMLQDESLMAICWEFSACINDSGLPDTLQAIGRPVDGTTQQINFQQKQQAAADIRIAEQHLQQSELFYRNLFANSLDGVLITDGKGIITFASASISQILGYSVEEILGKTTFEYTHPDDHSLAYSAFMDELYEQPRQKFISIRLLKKSGEWIWCIIRGHNLMQNPYVKGMVIYFYDDTLRKKAEDALTESEKRFRSLIYNLSQGVVLQNQKREVIIFNRAAQRILGISEDQLFGSSLFDPEWKIIHEDGHRFSANEDPIALAVQTKRPVRDIVMGVCRPDNNTWVWLLVNSDPVLDKEGNIFHVICSFTDITEQKRLSHELVEQEIQKQRQLMQATIDGQERERLEIGKELHDNISQHLTTTKLYLEVGRDKASDEVQEMITLAHKNLSDTINELRMLSQSLVPPTLGDLGMIESIQDLCDSLKRAHTFHIEFDYRHFNEDVLPENLKLMLFRIIQEQINNIIRHAHADSIQIKLQCDAEYIFLIIGDNGRGFDPSDYKKGLGLTNIMNRANLFNGKVEIDAAPGQGCSLSVAIPIPVNQLLGDELI